jgi:hypothetical protein
MASRTPVALHTKIWEAGGVCAPHPSVRDCGTAGSFERWISNARPSPVWIGKRIDAAARDRFSGRGSNEIFDPRHRGWRAGHALEDSPGAGPFVFPGGMR